jgi:hypothetical protein
MEKFRWRQAKPFPPIYDNLFFPNAFLFHDQDGKGSFEYADTDNKKNFKKNRQLQPASWPYHKKRITYIINSNGYRAPEWDAVDWKESVVIFGCSCTAGIGVAEDETISYQLSQLINRPVINLGAGGSSMLFSFFNSLRILENNLPIPYAVVQNWTTTNRFPIFRDTQVYHMGPWDSKSSFFKEYTSESDTQSMIMSKYISASSRTIWESKTRYASVSYFDDSAHFTESYLSTLDNKARDMMHPGVNAHKRMAELIAKLIE